MACSPQCFQALLATHHLLHLSYFQALLATYHLLLLSPLRLFAPLRSFCCANDIEMRVREWREKSIQALM